VIFGNAAGDHLIVLPALLALTSLFPSRLSLVCMPKMRKTFYPGLRFRSVHEIEMRRRRKQRVFNAERLAREIGMCDLFLSLNPWRSISLDRLVALLSAPLSIGFSPAFDLAFSASPKQHAADAAFRVPACFDPALRLEDFALRPRLPKSAKTRIRRFLQVAAPGKRILAVHNETKPDKTWPPGRLRDLVGAFLSSHSDFAVFILDFYKPKLNLAEFGRRVIHSPGLPLPDALAVLGESDLFLGADSCMLHGADLFRVPGVGLFGPTDPRRWGFRFSPHRHVSNPRGMIHIQESTVLEALEAVMA